MKKLPFSLAMQLTELEKMYFYLFGKMMPNVVRANLINSKLKSPIKKQNANITEKDQVYILIGHVFVSNMDKDAKAKIIEILKEKIEEQYKNKTSMF